MFMSLFANTTIRLLRYIKLYIETLVMIIRILSLEESILNELAKESKWKIWKIMKNDKKLCFFLHKITYSTDLLTFLLVIVSMCRLQHMSGELKRGLTVTLYRPL